MQHDRGERRMSLDPRRKQHTFRYIADLDQQADSATARCPPTLVHDDPNRPPRRRPTREFNAPDLARQRGGEAPTWGTGASSPPSGGRLNDSLPVQKHGAYHRELPRRSRAGRRAYDRMTHGKATVRGRDQYDVTFWDTRKKVHGRRRRGSSTATRRSSTGDLLDQGDYMYDAVRRPRVAGIASRCGDEAHQLAGGVDDLPAGDLGRRRAARRRTASSASPRSTA